MLLSILPYENYFTFYLFSFHHFLSEQMKYKYFLYVYFTKYWLVKDDVNNIWYKQ